MKRLKLINPRRLTKAQAAILKLRPAARGVVFDGEGLVGLLHVAKRDYYKLPGGGLEGDEDPRQAFDRECREELGCAVAVTGEIGIIEEYRSWIKRRQVSYCYTGQTVGPKRQPNFTAHEKERGFAVIWVTLAKATDLVGAGKPRDYEGSHFIKERDLFLLQQVAADQPVR